MAQSSLEALLYRLRNSAPNVLLQREAARAIESLERQLNAAKKAARQAELDARDDVAGASTEAAWRERQGDEYGSY
jgi:hypothetical protein